MTNTMETHGAYRCEVHWVLPGEGLGVAVIWVTRGSLFENMLTF